MRSWIEGLGVGDYKLSDGRRDHEAAQHLPLAFGFSGLFWQGLRFVSAEFAVCLGRGCGLFRQGVRFV